MHQRFPLTSETFVLQQVEGLIARGHEVTILAEWSEEHAALLTDARRVADLRKRVVPPDIPRHRFGRMLGAVSRLVTHRASWRVFARSIGLWGGLDARSLRPIYRAAQFVEMRDHADLVICHFGTNGVRALPLVGRGPDRIPLVTFFHGFDLSKTLQRRGPGIYRELFARGDLFLPVSERFRQRLIELGCDPARVAVHPTGVDLDRFRVREPRPPRADGVVRLLSVGRLVAKKGFADAIAAVAAWTRESPRIEYRIAGEGPERAALEKQIAALGVGDRVTLLGWQSHARVADLMSEACILLQPSVSGSDGDEEGVPVVLKEAMAAGLPIVASRHSGIPEIVEHDVRGLLVSERAPFEIVAALARLVDEPDLGVRLARQARAHAETSFDQRSLDARLEDLLARSGR